MRRLLVIGLALSTFAIACGDATEEGGTPTTSSTTTTSTTSTTTTTITTTTTEVSPALVGADLASLGPYPVGVTTRTLPTGNEVEIWYPAGPDAEGQTDSYSVRTFTPEVMRALVPEEINDLVTVAAGRDASVAEDGPFPLVMFSHGSTSFRFQSTNLTHHLASWGMVVASADHPTRALVTMLARPEDAPGSVDDVVAMRELVLADETLGAHIDADRVGMSGHSAGGGTTLAVTALGDIDGYVSYASGAFQDAPMPDVPSLFMAGEIDMIVSAGATLDAFNAAPAPSWYLELADSGHLAFSDLCAVGDGNATLIDLALAAGLEAFLTDGLVRLATDGCEEPNRPVTEVWPAIHQATTGFFRWVFGIDEDPIGLDEFTVDGVTVDAS